MGDYIWFINFWLSEEMSIKDFKVLAKLG